MSSTPPDPNAPRPGGLQSMLARLRGMVQASKPAEELREEDLLKWDTPAGQASPAATAPVATGPQMCPLCSSPRKGGLSYCEDCGYIFPTEAAPAPRAA